MRGLETAALSEDEFGERFGELLGLEDRTRLVERMFAGVAPGRARCWAPCARRARPGIRTGLISNSMGAGRYDRDSFPELFDGVVISGDVGMHKPQPEIFLLGARARRRARPSECVFVDDLRENCDGAEAVGMTAVLHRGADTTLPELERLLGVELA